MPKHLGNILELNIETMMLTTKDQTILKARCPD
jgi:hypothetical protein